MGVQWRFQCRVVQPGHPDRMRCWNVDFGTNGPRTKALGSRSSRHVLPLRTSQHERHLVDGLFAPPLGG